MSNAAQAAVDCLSRSLFGSELDREQLASLAGYMSELNVGAGEAMIREGDRDQRLFVIASGALDALRPKAQSEVVFARLAPGAIVGEVAFLQGLARTATVRAAEPSQAYVLERADFDRLVERDPKIACAVLRVLLRSMHALIARLTERNVDLIGYIYS